MRRWRIALGIGLFGAAVLAGVPASAGEPAPAPAPPATPDAASLGDSLSGRAKTDYLAGRGLFADADYAGAFVKFQSALEASKDNRLFWNLGACARGLHDYAEAVRYLERFQSEGGPLVTAKEKAEADELANALRPYVAAVTVHANEQGAAVTIDQTQVGSTPLEKRLVNLGQHRVVVSKSGFVDYVTPLNVSGPADVVVDIHLEPIAHVGKLSVHAAGGDAIAIDGRNVGVGTHETALPSGPHVVRVSATGKKTYENKISIEDGQTRSLDITLENAQLLPMWAWVGLGAVAVAGVSVGGYFAFRGSNDPPQPVVGTMAPGTVQLPSFGFGRY